MWFSLLVAIAVSVGVSTIVVIALRGPLSSVLESLCEGAEGVRFWAVFTVLMLYITPLFFALLFAVPGVGGEAGVTLSQAFTRSLSSVLGGLLVALLAVGWQISRLSRRVSLPPRRTSRNEHEFWGDKDT